jgi:hypothetical protein
LSAAFLAVFLAATAAFLTFWPLRVAAAAAVFLPVLFLEFLYAASSVNKFLFAGIERVALVAELNTRIDLRVLPVVNLLPQAQLTSVSLWYSG